MKFNFSFGKKKASITTIVVLSLIIASLSSCLKIEEKHIWARRPGNGEIPAYDFDNLIGKKIKVSVNKNQQLSWNMIEK